MYFLKENRNALPSGDSTWFASCTQFVLRTLVFSRGCFAEVQQRAHGVVSGSNLESGFKMAAMPTVTGTMCSLHVPSVESEFVL